MFFAVRPEAVNKHISLRIHRPPAVFSRHIFDEPDRPFFFLQIKQLDLQSAFELLFQPVDFPVVRLVLRIDETNHLGMIGKITGGYFNDLRI
jgi:hypothetical protein